MIEKVLVRMPGSLKSLIKTASGRLGVTMNALILQILWSWAAKTFDVEVDTNDTDGDTQL